MTVVVTGCAGFIGSAVARRLLADGRRVIGIDRITPYYDVHLKRRNVEQLQRLGMEFHEVDLLDAPLPELLRGAEVIFHHAGQPGVRSSWGSEFPLYSRNNIEATQCLLEAASKLEQLSSFVYASSSSVYGNALGFPTHESALPAPVSPYGVTKLAAEHLCSLYAETQGLPTVSLRYFTVYGPGQRPDMAFSRFCSSVHNGTPIPLYGDGTQVRDFTYIDDVVEANLLAASAGLQPGTVLNIAGGSSTTVNEVLEILAGFSGTHISVEHREAVPGDALRTGGDTTRARHDLGWVPKVHLAEGLSRQYEWASTFV